MEILENIKTWGNLISIGIFLIAIYWSLKFINYLLINFTRKNVINKRIVHFLDTALLIFKPIIIAVLLLNFIAINFINHSILLTIIAVFGYKHIHNYINGIILKINPLISSGTLLEIGKFKGEIKKMLPFGMVVNTETGERFVSYSEVEAKGFAVRSNENSLLRQTLFIETKLSKDVILDLLFENPILNNEEIPTLRIGEKEQQFKLQYSLESGASSEDLRAFLKENNIKTSLTTINTIN